MESTFGKNKYLILSINFNENITSSELFESLKKANIICSKEDSSSFPNKARYASKNGDLVTSIVHITLLDLGDFDEKHEKELIYVFKKIYEKELKKFYEKNSSFKIKKLKAYGFRSFEHFFFRLARKLGLYDFFASYVLLFDNKSSKFFKNVSKKMDKEFKKITKKRFDSYSFIRFIKRTPFFKHHITIEYKEGFHKIDKTLKNVLKDNKKLNIPIKIENIMISYLSKENELKYVL